MTLEFVFLKKKIFFCNFFEKVIQHNFEFKKCRKKVLKIIQKFTKKSLFQYNTLDHFIFTFIRVLFLKYFFACKY